MEAGSGIFWGAATASVVIATSAKPLINAKFKIFMTLLLFTGLRMNKLLRLDEPN